MSPLPVAMRDRWLNRTEPRAGEGTVYWHALMSRYPEAKAAATAAQAVLEEFDGFHLTPREWLHMTTLVAGSTDVVPRDRLPALLNAARDGLQGVQAPRVELGRILYHPEAIMLAVEPVEELCAIQQIIRRATAETTGQPIDDAVPAWIPHVTIGYSTTGQPAAPIIEALGATVAPQWLTVDSISLVVQWGPERQWDWEQVGSVELEAHQS